MDEPARPSSFAARSRAWCTLLPAAILAWPLERTPLADDPFPHLAGAGIAALAALPAAAALVLARGRLHGRAITPIVLLWAWFALGALLGPVVDPFEARRAVVQAGLWVVFFAAGLALWPEDRGLFLRGLLGISIALTGGALSRFLFSGEHELAGVLGNSGLLSQAALPGAVAGAWFAAGRRGTERAAGFAAAALFLAHAGLAPVWAGGGAFALAVLLSAFLARRARADPPLRLRLACVAAGAIVLLPALRLARSALSAESAPVVSGANGSSAASADVGGLAVRLGIWSRIPAVLAAHPLAGLGPGQFRARFPAFRDAREIERSRHGACSRADTEVEHAHQDLLEACAELGIVGGGLFALFVACAALAAHRALLSDDGGRACAGAAGLALLVNGLFHAPLFANPTAATLGLALLGSTRGARPRDGGTRGRTPALAVAAIALVGAWLAWPLVTHGRALAGYVRAAERLVALQAEPPDRPLLGGEIQDAAREARSAVERGLAAAPDSAYARLLDARSAPEQERLATWNAVLEVRPDSAQALEAIGLFHARAGEIEAARVAWERALELTAEEARILENLARMELVDGEPARGLELVERLRARGCLDEGWKRPLGIELVLRGHFATGARLFLERELDALVPEELFAEAGRVPNDPRERELPQRAEALKTLAQILWARTHVARGDFDAAVRSYRQALVSTRLVIPTGAPFVRAELAAAECLAGRAPDASRTLEGLSNDQELQDLPEWARRTLRESALLHGRGLPEHE